MGDGERHAVNSSTCHEATRRQLFPDAFPRHHEGLFVSFKFLVQLIDLVAVLRSLSIRLFHVRLELFQSEYPRPSAPLGRSATCGVRPSSRTRFASSSSTPRLLKALKRNEENRAGERQDMRTTRQSFFGYHYHLSESRFHWHHSAFHCPGSLVKQQLQKREVQSEGGRSCTN